MINGANLQFVSLCTCWSWGGWQPPCVRSRYHGREERWKAACRHTFFYCSHLEPCLLSTHMQIHKQTSIPTHITMDLNVFMKSHMQGFQQSDIALWGAAPHISCFTSRLTFVVKKIKSVWFKSRLASFARLQHQSWALQRSKQKRVVLRPFLMNSRVTK